MMPEKKVLILALFIYLFFYNTSFCRAQLGYGISSGVSPSAGQAQPAELYNNAEFNQAIKNYHNIAQKNNLSGYLNLATIFKDLNHYESGIKILNYARIKFGNDFRILELLGKLYYLNGQLDRAIDTLLKLSQIKPDNSNVLITLGLCYQEKENNQQAQIYFEKVLELNKNNVLAHLSLADLYYHQNKLEESAREYKILNFVDASIEQIYESWANILSKIGNFKEALKLYEKVIFRQPQNRPAQEKLKQIRQELGKEYFIKEEAKRKISKEKKLIFVKPMEKIKNPVYIKIGLIHTDGSVEFKCSTSFTIKTKNNHLLVGQGFAGESYTILPCGENKLLLTNDKKENILIDEPVMIKPMKKEGTITLFDVKFGKNNFWSNIEDRSYRGEIEVSIDNKIIKIINTINLEEYLYGVVPAEMPANWPQEALKAQTIAARSESIAKLRRHWNDGFDLCAEVHCQVYSGVEKETQLSNMAVDSTRGIILEYNSQAMDAIYSSNCGGHTQSNIFENSKSAPYFTGVKDMDNNQNLNFPLAPFELESWLKNPPTGIYCNIPEYSKDSNFRWVRIYSAAQLRQMIDKVSNVGDIKKIIILKRNQSGHVDKLKIVGTESSFFIEKELNIRKTLGNLRGSMFKVEIKFNQDHLPEKFIFYGGGWGHGVGMCQAGACGMAKAGKSYIEILQHYFSQARLKKI